MWRGEVGTSVPPTRTVFVKNLPYDATEAEIDAHFRSVGPVKGVRLAYDKDSGKPRGFGFVEYYDIETAVAAQRHLQGSQIRGRALRLDTAVDDEESLAQIRAAQGGTGGGGGGGGWSGVQRDPLWERASREGPPIGADRAMKSGDGVAVMAPGPVTDRQGRPDAVTQVLSGLTEAQLWEVLSQMKGILQDDPTQARHLLVTHPQLTRALLQAEILLGLVVPPPPPDNGARGPSAGGSGFTPPVPGPSYEAGPPRPGPPLRASPYPGQQFDAPPAAAAVPPAQPAPARQGTWAVPARAPPAAAPGAPAAAAPPPAAAPAVSPEQQRLLDQVLRLTPEQIAKLEPHQREQVLRLQQQLRQA